MRGGRSGISERNLKEVMRHTFLGSKPFLAQTFREHCVDFPLAEASGVSYFANNIMATCSDGPKISNLVSETSDPWFSFEYFPPKTQKGLSYLKQKVQRMKSLGPLFTGFTWGTGESTAKATIELTNTAQNELGCVANMHLTCTSENTKVAGEALAACKNMGVRNIVALRGDPPHGQQQWAAFEGGFGGVLDLVKFIRDKHGEYFCISVAGYPEGHPDTISVVEGGLAALSPKEARRARVSPDGVVTVCHDRDFEKEMTFLKEQCDAGADVIITQMFLDAQVYVEFLEACRERDIWVPVVPGIMCFNTLRGFERMTNLFKTRLPSGLLETAKDANVSDETFKTWSIQQSTRMCKICLDVGAPGLHFYTLNRERVVTSTLVGLGLVTEEQVRPCVEAEDDATILEPAEGIFTVDMDMETPGISEHAEEQRSMDPEALFAELQRLRAENQQLKEEAPSLDGEKPVENLATQTSGSSTRQNGWNAQTCDDSWWAYDESQTECYSSDVRVRSGDRWCGRGSGWDERYKPDASPAFVVGSVVKAKYGDKFFKATVISAKPTSCVVQWAYDNSQTECDNNDIRVETESEWTKRGWKHREYHGQAASFAFEVGSAVEAKYGDSFFEAKVVSPGSSSSLVKWMHDESEMECANHDIRALGAIVSADKETSPDKCPRDSSQWSSDVMRAVETMATSTSIAGEIVAHSVSCSSVPARGGKTVQLYKVWCKGADTVAEIVGWGERASKLEAACSRKSPFVGSFVVIGPVGATGEGALFEVKSDDLYVEYTCCLRQTQKARYTLIRLIASCTKQCL